MTDDLKYWQNKAEETRAISTQWSSEARVLLLKIADQYDRVAAITRDLAETPVVRHPTIASDRRKY